MMTTQIIQTIANLIMVFILSFEPQNSHKVNCYAVTKVTRLKVTRYYRDVALKYFVSPAFLQFD
jgi:hypothetical protein